PPRFPILQFYSSHFFHAIFFVVIHLHRSSTIPSKYPAIFHDMPTQTTVHATPHFRKLIYSVILICSFIISWFFPSCFNPHQSTCPSNPFSLVCFEIMLCTLSYHC